MRSRLARSARWTALALGSLAALSVALHCGTTGESTFSNVTGTPCETVYKGLCGKPCGADAECGSGLYCSAAKACTADCAPNQGCAACSPNGRCEGIGGPGFGDGGDLDASGNGDALCADTDVTLTKIIPKVLFLLDQSSSMYHYKFPGGSSNGCNPDCRWTVLKDALIGPADNKGGLFKELEGEAEIGLELYSATDGKNDGDDSFLTFPTDNVCPRFNGKTFDGLSFQLNAYAAAEAQLRDAGVDDDTPTGPAIRTVVGLSDDGGVGDPKGFAGIASTEPKVLVLVTDGEPAICGENSPSDDGRARVVKAVQDTFKHGIRTFVIAIGDTVTEAHFDAVANAGQGLDPATGDAGAYMPSSTTALTTALQDVVKAARSCTFDLNGAVQAGQERRGTVMLNGAAVPYDEPGAPDEGWRLVSPSRIELVGEACKTLKGSPDAQLSARFPCGAITTFPR